MEIGSKDKDSIITVLICPVNLFFYGSKKNSLSRICYYKYTKNPYYLQVCRPLCGGYFRFFYEKSSLFIAPYRIAYSIPQMAFAALVIVILF